MKGVIKHEGSGRWKVLCGFAMETEGVPDAKDNACNARCHRAMLSILDALAMTKFLTMLMKAHIALGFGGEASRACKELGAGPDLLDDRDMSVQGSFDLKALCIPVLSSKPPHTLTENADPHGKGFR